MSHSAKPAAEPAECQTCWLKITQREMSPPSDDSHEGEWRSQLAASILCALFATAGYLVPHSAASIVLYSLAYLAGSWFDCPCDGGTPSLECQYFYDSFRYVSTQGD